MTSLATVVVNGFPEAIGTGFMPTLATTITPVIVTISVLSLSPPY